MKEKIVNIIDEILRKKEFPSVNYSLEPSKNPDFGDLSANAALLLAKQLKKNPRDIAKEISAELEKHTDIFTKVEIAGAGFINLFVNNSVYLNVLPVILEKQSEYGKSKINNGKKANLEWVSANPTGPLHAGHGRQVCLGKAIANLLEWSGYEVTREYYYNDAGNQMNNLAKSVYARYMQKFDKDYPFPEDGYNGDYIRECADKIFAEKGDSLKEPDNLDYFKETAEKNNFDKIRSTLQTLGVKHDIYFNETDLYKNKDIEKLLADFKKMGASREEEGAVWLKMDKSRFQKDKVIVKSTGEPTYRLPDMAYHINKIKRGFDYIIDIFGSDHGDTYKEVLYGMELAGYKTDNIKVIIHQMVTFKIGDQSVKMSKRSDNVYYLDDLINDVGVDATQFFFVMRAANTHLDFDIELAKEQSDKNPVYYLQYAYARISGIFRNAKENLPSDIFGNEFKLDLLNAPEEIDLLKVLSGFPEEIVNVSQTLEPHKIITYLNGVAESFHKFYHNNRVINTEDMETTKARLKLCLAAATVLKNGFEIIGINAPERM
ncbi:MAG: arginine--tRNA ligase [Ignavibacteria bacterium]|nr:arginine--tRNA ligase [Ignavibacteria bacterium]